MTSSEKSLSFRISNPLTRQELVGQRMHDMRLGRQPTYVCADRTPLNTTLSLAPGYDSLKNAWTRLLDRDEAAMDARRVKKTARKALWRSAILTFSSEAQKALAGRDPDDEAKAYFEDFGRRHGVRLLWVVAHRDESAIHYHAAVEGIRADGRALRLQIADVSNEQDIAGQHFAHLGIQRGRRKAARMADAEPASAYINRSVQELHRDLPSELEAARSALAETFASIEKHQARAESARLKAEEYTADAQKAQARLQRYEERARHAQARWEALQGQIEALEARCQRLRDVAIPAMREILDREGFTNENLDLMARMDGAGPENT